ncbi:hypothetical protein UC77_04500 [Clostridium baratii]|nr:hypothetical protein UC77_04500 [Clostridium baratii]
MELPENLKRFIKNKEEFLFAAKTNRDAAIITDKKILICDKKGVTGKNREYFTIPYRKIISYGIEISGGFGKDPKLKIELPGQAIEIELLKDKNGELGLKIYDAIDAYMVE